jgi:hypothetical protein
MGKKLSLLQIKQYPEEGITTSDGEGHGGPTIHP